MQGVGTNTFTLLYISTVLILSMQFLDLVKLSISLKSYFQLQDSRTKDVILPKEFLSSTLIYLVFIGSIKKHIEIESFGLTIS